MKQTSSFYESDKEDEYVTKKLNDLTVGLIKQEQIKENSIETVKIDA